MATGNSDTYTTNYNLIKPGYNSAADIDKINSNMDTIDTTIKGLSEQIAQFEGVEIAANTDLNSLRTPGFYYSKNTATTGTITNKPTGVSSAFVLEVTKKGDYISQMINEGSTLYVRELFSYGFSGWSKLAITDNTLPSYVPAGTQPSTINDFYSGLTYVSNASQGAPRNYSMIMAFRVADYYNQFAFGVGNSTPAMYIRQGTPSGWGTWQQLAPIEMFDIEISNGQDLDSLTKEGMYGCATGSTAQTLVHCPVTSNFTMLNMRKGNLLNQIIFSGGGIYVRSGSSSGYGHWFKYTGTDTGA